MDWLRQRLADLPLEEAVRLLEQIAQNNPGTAFQLAVELGSGGDPTGTARKALRSLAGHDIEAAMAWGASQPASPEMEIFWAAMTDMCAGSDPERAFGVTGKTSGTLRFQLLQDVFAEWAGEDAAAAKRAAAALADRGERLACHLAILPSEIERDPAQAVAWIESITDPLLQDTLYYHSMRSWASIDPAAAAAFVATQMESDYKSHVAGSLVESWVREDARAALSWAAGLPEQESREQAVFAGLKVVMETSMELAAEYALQLPVEGSRAAAVEYIVSDWIARDPNTLQDWIEKIPDSTMKGNLLRMVEDHMPYKR